MDMVGDDSIPVDDQILKKDMEDFLMKALDQLSDREKQIIIYRYGLDNEKPKTLEEIGTIYNLSRERIRQIENQALGKLKQYSDCTFFFFWKFLKNLQKILLIIWNFLINNFYLFLFLKFQIFFSLQHKF